MANNGKGMRTCCDSPNQRGQDHIKGCANYHETKQVRFIRMDDSDNTVMLERGFYNWLTERKLRLSVEIEIANDMVLGVPAVIQNIVECDGNIVGTAMTVSYQVAA